MTNAPIDPLQGAIVEPIDVPGTVRSSIRIMLGASGLVSLAVGILVLAAPVKTAMVVAGFISVYAVIAGLVNIAIGVFSGKVGIWTRLGYLLLGLAFLVAGGIALGNLRSTAESLAVVLGIIIGVVWIIEGIVGLTMIGDTASKVWTLVYAVFSVVAGIVLVTSPLWGVAILWVLMGLSLVLLGVVQIVRGITFGAAR